MFPQVHQAEIDKQPMGEDFRRNGNGQGSSNTMAI